MERNGWRKKMGGVDCSFWSVRALCGMRPRWRKGTLAAMVGFADLGMPASWTGLAASVAVEGQLAMPTIPSSQAEVCRLEGELSRLQEDPLSLGHFQAIAKRWETEFSAVAASGVEEKDKALALDRTLIDVLERLKVVVPGTRFTDGDFAAGEPPRGPNMDEEEPKMDEEDKEELDLLKAALEKKGDFLSQKQGNGKMGGWWQAALMGDPELKKAYEAVGRKYTAQRSFRHAWAQQVFEEKTQSKKKVVVDESLDILKGEYVSFSRIWKAEGKDAAGLEAAKEYVNTCLQYMMEGRTVRGRSYIEYNDMTKRFDFLYVKKTISETEGTKWAMATDYGAAGSSQEWEIPQLSCADLGWGGRGITCGCGVGERRGAEHRGGGPYDH